MVNECIQLLAVAVKNFVKPFQISFLPIMKCISKSVELFRETGSLTQEAGCGRPTKCNQ